MYSLLSSRVILHIREFVDTHGNATNTDLSTPSALTIRQRMERKTYPELLESELKSLVCCQGSSALTFIRSLQLT
jgi:hypothetical protein